MPFAGLSRCTNPDLHLLLLLLLLECTWKDPHNHITVVQAVVVGIVVVVVVDIVLEVGRVVVVDMAVEVGTVVEIGKVVVVGIVVGVDRVVVVGIVADIVVGYWCHTDQHSYLDNYTALPTHH